MRRYTPDEEERVRVQAQVRDWTRTGLLDGAQGARLEAELRGDLKRTNPFLRAGLALFTAFIVAMSVMLVFQLVGLHDVITAATVKGVAALVCIGIAEALVGVYRCYRFGVEEALAVAAVVLIANGGGDLTAAMQAAPPWPFVVALLLGTAGGFALYRRFGFIYAAIGSLLCLAAVPFQLALSATMHRLLAAAVLASVFVIARATRVKYRDDYPGDEYGDLQAVALAALYFTLNLQVADSWKPGGLFYWSTYCVIWALPLIGLRLGIRDKDRELMDVSMLLAIVTLLTNKPYLGWPRHSWDPILFGLLLIGIAAAVRRWLSHGPAGERNGFTAARILDSDRETLSMLSVASALAPPGVVSGAAPPRAEPPEFGGGRSGGGGGGAGF